MHSDNRGCSKIDFPFVAPNYTTLAIDSRGYMTWDTSPKVEYNILKNGTYKTDETKSSKALPVHQHVRGGSYYH